MATRNPQRIELGQMLERLRERAGVTPAEVDEEMHWYEGKCRRVETGDRVVSYVEIDRLADRYKASKDRRSTLHHLAEAARRREPTASVDDFAQTYITLERQASGIDYYHGELICGLFQTENYARTILATGTGHVPQRLLDRMARQKVLTSNNPPKVRMVLGEAALHIQVGGAVAMRDQLRHLLRATELPNVAIRILPFAAGAHQAFGVPFYVVTVAPPASITRVYAEGLTDATYIQAPDQVLTYEGAFTRVWNLAASDQDSAKILRRCINLTEERDGDRTLAKINAEPRRE
jgi:hypothetical protein